MADPMSHEQMIEIMTGVSNITREEAKAYLVAAAWDLDVAANLCLQERGDEPSGGQNFGQEGQSSNDDLYSQPSSAAPFQPSTNVARTVGAPAQRVAPSGGRRIATLSDFSRDDGHGHGHAHGHDESDDDSEDDEGRQDYFTGGEKSGLAVQDPGQQGRGRGLVQDILKRAVEPGADSAHPGPSASTTRFTGSGQTLGSEDTPSRTVPDPSSSRPQGLAPVTRNLTFWRDGFSIEDGPLMRYDDPENQEILRAIRQGRAPPSLMNVEPGQPTDVNVFRRMDEEYVPPKTSKKPFQGHGQRLGSPVPEASGQQKPSAPAAAVAPAASSGAEADQPKIDVDSSQPSVSLQIRLGDGTRLVSRFNTTHTVGDIYAFISASHPDSSRRSWVLMTTFPSKELSDKDATIGDVTELKKGGTVVQKWV